MNGDLQTILNAVNDINVQIATLETTQTLHHEQNQKDIGGIADLTRAVDKHCHEIGKLKVHRAIHWVILGAIATALILK